jgi:hypothetical protein
LMTAGSESETQWAVFLTSSRKVAQVMTIFGRSVDAIEDLRKVLLPLHRDVAELEADDDVQCRFARVWILTLEYLVAGEENVRQLMGRSGWRSRARELRYHVDPDELQSQDDCWS